MLITLGRVGLQELSQEGWVRPTVTLRGGDKIHECSMYNIIIRRCECIRKV